jgi:hypothetical protein
VRQAYQAEIKRDLVEDIKSETSGDYERALVSDIEQLQIYIDCRFSPSQWYFDID